MILSGLIPSLNSVHNDLRKRALNERNCRFEELEKRYTLSATPLEAYIDIDPPIEFGSVYYEDNMSMGRDSDGDVFQITWAGGATGTQLSEVRISLDKNGNGIRDNGEAFWDFSGENGGVYGSFPLRLISADGIGSYGISAIDGGQTLVLQFTGFDAGEKFVFSVDCDEQGHSAANAIVEGAEFEGSILTGVFTNADYHELTAKAIFYDAYADPNVLLDLPKDDYGNGSEIQTAGAFGTFYQIPKTGSLSGYVYEDVNDNGLKESGEKGIEKAALELWVWNTDKYVYTGRVIETNANGYYKFSDLDSGLKYRIVEKQPSGYIDGKDTPGSLGGIADANDIIYSINVAANQHGTDYNFGELKTGSLSGHVYEDADCGGHFDDDEIGIANVQLSLWIWTDGAYIETGITTTTDVYGYYIFDDLDPFQKYQITERQPSGYFTGKQEAGSLGGTALSPPLKTINEIIVAFDAHGTGYNFAERLPASISGYVYEDLNDNGIKETGENGIKNVEVKLFVWDKASESYVWTERTATTDSNGKYIFDNLDPCKLYAVKETQPTNYIDGKDAIGEAGGILENDHIYDIDPLPGTEAKNYNFGERLPASLSGYVFQDGDAIKVTKGDNIPPMEEIGTGIFQTDSKRISGVVLILADEHGNPLRDSDGNLITATTDANGFYEFKMLEGKKTYSVLETHPDGYTDGIDTNGTSGGDAVNPFDAETIAKLEEMGIVVATLKNDAIIGVTILDGEHSQHNNFSELAILWIDPPTPKPDPDPDPVFVPVPMPYVPVVVPTPNPVSGSPALFSPLMWQPGTSTMSLSPLYGGGSGASAAFTWHLSVLNAGYPRDREQLAMLTDGEYTGWKPVLQGDGANDASQFVNVSWNPLPMKKATWLVRDKYGNVSQKFVFGTEDARPLVADFNGDGIDEIAIFIDGNWHIDINGNGVWDPSDLWAKMGTALDTPIVGDWDGDGKADIGIFGPRWSEDDRALSAEPGLPSDLNTMIAKRPKNMPPTIAEATNGVRTLKHSERGNVRSDLIDHVFEYGDEGDVAFTGDFSGTGVHSVGVYSKGNWKIDTNGNGRFDDGDLYLEGIGLPGDIPVIGDFGGTGKSAIGVYRSGTWLLDTKGDFRLDTKIQFGERGDTPVVGDFNGDGVAQLALYRRGAETPALQTQMQRAPIDAGYAAQYGSKTAETDARPERTMHTPHTDAPLGSRL